LIFFQVYATDISGYEIKCTAFFKGGKLELGVLHRVSVNPIQKRKKHNEF